MKKKFLSTLLCIAMVATLLVGCSSEVASPASDKAANTKSKVILITMDSTDQHWVALDKGAKKAATELGVEYKWMAPDKKDDAQQIERINNAIADGADAILIAANGPDAITGALEEAKAAGIVIVYVDSPANSEAVATFSTDNKAAGKTAGEQMLAALTAGG